MHRYPKIRAATIPMITTTNRVIKVIASASQVEDNWLLVFVVDVWLVVFDVKFAGIAAGMNWKRSQNA